MNDKTCINCIHKDVCYMYRLNEEGCEMYNKGYMSGYETCKKDVIRSIAKQYNEHNELVPSWLHIGNMRGGRQ